MVSVPIFLIFLILLSAVVLEAQTQKAISKNDVIGEVFGKPVTAEEFNYYVSTALTFTRSGKEAKNEDEVRAEAWQDLIYRHAAREEGITVGREDVEKEVKRLMAEKRIEFGTKEYKVWVMMNFNEEPDVFEKRVEDLLVINKFMQAKTSPEVTVTEDQMEQKYRNQYNSFESEYILFDSEAQAGDFAEKVSKDPLLWKNTYDEKKPLGQKGATWINIMSLEALIDLWQIPKEDAYRILSHKEGDFIPAKFIYGYGVFRLMQKQEANMAEYNDEKKEYYRNMMTQSRKYGIVKKYFEDLIKRANHRDFIAEKKRQDKIGELMTKSIVALKTNRGIIELKLYPDIAPFACENFIGLIEKGYYDGVVFHRIIKDFMIQSGDPTGTGTGGESIWGEPFVDEVDDKVMFDKPGMIAMANSGPNTNTSQFFITVKETPWLNKKHTIFGEVASGMDVVRLIEKAGTDSADKPKAEQKIIKAYIKKTQ